MAEKRGRKPSENKREIFLKVCHNIAGGDSLKEACEKEGKPENFYFRFLADNIDDEIIRQVSAHAREMKAFGYFNKCEQALKDLELGLRDYSTAKVLFDCYLRLAAKANQKTFGEKITQELTGANGADLFKGLVVEFVGVDIDEENTDTQKSSVSTH